MEAVGVGLGAASVAFEIFRAIKIGYRTFHEVADMPKDCESLRLSLRLECTRLLGWGDLAGLSDQNKHLEFDRKLKTNRITIMALLSEMKTLLDGIRKISLRYDDVLLPADDGDVAQLSQTAKRLSLANQQEEFNDTDMEQFDSLLDDQLPDPKQQKWLTKNIKRAIHGLAHPNFAMQRRRITWVLSDKDAFKTGVARLRELTDYLHESLGDHQMSILVENTKEVCMVMLQMTQSIDEIKEIVKRDEIGSNHGHIERQTRRWLSLGDTVVEQDSSEYTAESGSITTRLPQTLFAQLAQFRQNVVELDADSSENLKPLDGKGNPRAPRLVGEHLQSLKLDLAVSIGAGRVPAMYNGAAAWVEWKVYKPMHRVSELGQSELVPPPNVAIKIERLVTILHMGGRPTQFRVPLCEGYFEDRRNDRFGLIYRIPEADSQAAGIVSLSQLLQEQASGRAPPPLHSRIGLARELATSLFFLHAVNWLHKGLRDDGIVVPTRDGVPEYSHPYISGFEYSRPDEEGESTTAAPADWAVHMHPDYLGVDGLGYRKTFDMYSMGIILLEIAWWKPAEEILGFESPLRQTKVESSSTSAAGAVEPCTKKDVSPREEQKPAGEASDSHGKEDGSGQEREAHQKKNEEFRRKTYSTESLPDLKNIRKRILTDEPALLEHVVMTMGSRYCEAVRACIGGLEYFQLPADADETSGEIAPLLQQAYLRLVVDVLREIVV